MDDYFVDDINAFVKSFEIYDVQISSKGYLFMEYFPQEDASKYFTIYKN